MELSTILTYLALLITAYGATQEYIRLKIKLVSKIYTILFGITLLILYLSTLDFVQDILKQIGKVPVVCNARAGYIVPRIQALAMNEAARMVEEGVASAEDIDIAIRTGFGLRFSVLGLLEFIDWGGGDILFYASQYLEKELGSRYSAPKIISENMQNNRNGLREKQGFYNYVDMDIDAYKLGVLKAFSNRIEMSNLKPVFDVVNR